MPKETRACLRIYIRRAFLSGRRRGRSSFAGEQRPIFVHVALRIGVHGRKCGCAIEVDDVYVRGTPVAELLPGLYGRALGAVKRAGRPAMQRQKTLRCANLDCGETYASRAMNCASATTKDLVDDPCLEIVRRALIRRCGKARLIAMT